MEIRRYRAGDEDAVSQLIQRTLNEVNTEDPEWENDWLRNQYTPEYIAGLSAVAHTYVICDDDRPVGTGTIKTDGEAKEGKQSEIIACFISPDYIGKGLGRKLFEALETDEYFVSARRVWLTSSIMAQGFYEHMGYVNPNGHGVRNADTLLEYEKTI